MDSHEALLLRTQELKPEIFRQQREDELTTALLYLMWDLGLTPTEITLLRWVDLDLTAGVLRVKGREVPIPPEATAFFSALERRGAYVVATQKSRGRPANRITVSRKLRFALDGVGLTEVEPKLLRELFILEQLDRLSIEAAARVTGLEIVSLQQLYRRHRHVPLEAERRSKTGTLDLPALKRALEQEGDTLDRRVLLLSWQGGLHLREMQDLRWDDVDLAGGTWRIAGEERSIPLPLRPHLAQWQEEGPGYVLRTQTGRRMELPFLSRRVSEFFIRHGLEEVSLPFLRGRVLTDEDYQARLLALLTERPDLTHRQTAEALGLSLPMTRRLWQRLEEQHRLPHAEAETRLVRGQREREKLAAILQARAGETVTAAQLQELMGLAPGSLYHYLKYFQDRGALRREERGVYRCQP